MTLKREQEVLKWWREYRNVGDVSALSGISRGRIYKILDKNNIPRPRRSKHEVVGYVPRRRVHCYRESDPLPITGERALTVGEDKLLTALHREHGGDSNEMCGAC